MPSRRAMKESSEGWSCKAWRPRRATSRGCLSGWTSPCSRVGWGTVYELWGAGNFRPVRVQSGSAPRSSSPRLGMHCTRCRHPSPWSHVRPPLTAHHRGWHLRGVGGGDLSPGLSLRAGFRADRYSHEQRLRVSPRVALRLSLGERADLFAAAGRYHQVLPAPGLRAESATESNAGWSLSWDPSLPVADATHVVVGMEQEFDRDVQLVFTAFAKRFSGLGQEGGETSRSSGTELRVSREGDRLRGWFGYTLSWFWVDEGPTGSSRFDGRHLLSTGLEAVLPGGIQVGGSLGYGAGLPMTAVGLPSRGRSRHPLTMRVPCQRA